ncbi:MAG TPA: hypothetical protein VFE46_17090 [Pirellulales bacterium]|jgi:hypothetical protein|nr:hypothetical protein [Pirellulales bacterium]
MPNDIDIAREFAKRIHVDGMHHDANVELIGHFHQLPYAGVEKLAGNSYQFVVDPQLALVAILPDEFIPEPAISYRITGKLTATGHLGLFPGVRVQTFARD